MRCLGLVEAWCKRGAPAYFLTRCDNEDLRKRMQAAGAKLLPLSGDRDLQSTIFRAKDVKASFVVLDGYDFDLDYQRALRAAGCRLMVIDDSVRLPFYEADILLNQNLGAERLEYKCNPDAGLLLGPEYALIRREFMVWRGRLHTVPDTARKILVTMGGADNGNVSLRVINALRQLKIARLEIRVVAGPANPHIKELRDAAAGFPGRLELLTSVSEMGLLMAWADLAITGAGSTCWELACVGLPAVTLMLAENQRVIAEKLGAAGVVFNLGCPGEVSLDRIAATVDALLYSSFRRLRMIQRGRALIDGKGAQRVATALSQRTCIRAG